MDPRRYSDASSNGSLGSVWSTTDSECFVYTDDPVWAPWWGYEGVRGAVTRKDDRRDERRVRVAAHFLRGPFAGHKSKKHHHHHRDSDSRSNYSSSSGSSSSSRRQRQFSRGPSPMPPPPNGYPGSPHPHHQQPQHYDNFAQGPPMGMMGQRPPPPPPMAGPPPQPGFEAGFIQLGGGGGPPPQRDPVWGHDAHYNGEPEVWD
ncbi:hypothetical protein F5Y12DRAFT_715701 [Xylaria sp. FL1777]|nr:hypothetical protein F5Y12DRAFT_715701 [Xylaria sp. FL1777]